MRDWIAVIMAVLGVLLVLAGGTLLVLNALAAGAARPAITPAGPDETTGEVPVGAPTAGPAGAPARPPVTARLTDAARRLPAADRLIGWGIVLLVLAAIAAGAITFNFQLAANSPR
jgi:hypothetical protein